MKTFISIDLLSFVESAKSFIFSKRLSWEQEVGYFFPQTEIVTSMVVQWFALPFELCLEGKAQSRM